MDYSKKIAAIVLFILVSCIGWAQSADETAMISALFTPDRTEYASLFAPLFLKQVSIKTIEGRSSRITPSLVPI